MFMLLALLGCDPHTLPGDTGTPGAGGADDTTVTDTENGDDTGTVPADDSAIADDSAVDDTGSGTDTAVGDTGVGTDTATDDSAVEDSDTTDDTDTTSDDSAVEDTDTEAPTYTDVDGDGWSVEGGDCNDLASAVNPAAVEIAGNAIDENCDGTVEPAASTDTGSGEDTAGEDTGVADSGGTDTGTEPVDTGVVDTGPTYTDGDADGWSVEGGDCDDADATVSPAAIETANDGIDQDCSGSDLVTETDADSDGYGVSVDCDDTDAAINPGAAEVCDGVDQDCDGAADNGVTVREYLDQDGDGWGDELTGTDTCSIEAGYVDNTQVGDCDTEDATIYPGATEVANDGIDQDCDEADLVVEADVDGDGSGVSADCDDGDATVYPGATEIADDGVDQDCDGSDVTLATLQDEALCDGTDQMACFVDVDEDGVYETLLMDAGQWTLPELYDADAEIYENGYGTGCDLDGSVVEASSLGYYVIDFSGDSCTTQLTLVSDGYWWQNYTPATDGSDVQGVFVNTGGWDYLVGIDWRATSGLQF